MLSNSSNRNMERVDFLCGNYLQMNFIYAIKKYPSDWHYFEEEDSLFDVHVSLPPNLVNKISQLLNKVEPISLSLNADQLANYVEGDKFVFKGKELKTVIQLSGLTARRRDQLNVSKRVKPRSTHDLVFQPGKTNPAIFLRTFEKCSDVKSEKDKLCKLRNFVNENDKPEFSKLFFGSDWQAARSTFLRKYSMEYTQNKQKELDFSYANEPSLRTFVARKMDALSTYTTLSIENQIEVILSELPNSIANTFIVEDKLNSTKEEILEFCDVIQEFIEDVNAETASVRASPTNNSDTNSSIPSSVVNGLEIFTFQSGVESSSDTGSTSTNSSRTGGRGKFKRLSRSGRPAKIPKTVSEESETSSDG